MPRALVVLRVPFTTSVSSGLRLGRHAQMVPTPVSTADHSAMDEKDPSKSQSRLSAKAGH